MTHSALIIDDEKDIRELIALSLDRIGLITHTAANLDEARNLLNEYTFDVCLTDMRLPDGNGVEFVKYALEIQPELPIAVITAHGNMDAAVEAMKNGAFDFVSKPVDIKLLRELVQQAIRPLPAEQHSGLNQAPNDSIVLKDKNPAHEMSANNVTPPSEQSNGYAHSSKKTLEGLSHRDKLKKTATMIGAGDLIGQSDLMKDLRLMISKVARTNTPILIAGESGTGKEVIAKLIHRNSGRHESSFVAINCGAIPSELMESEMFGHRKGSFTGAHTDYVGLFMQADGGTLFLDEVAELPLHMQVKLLRAIQEKSIRPVGSSTELTVDVRIISASHKLLTQEIEEARFRHDLYYRLNVIELQAPCLRDRPEDIIDLCNHILNKLSNTQPLDHSLSLSNAALDELLAYRFPGNVRELENILERAITLSDGEMIEPSDLSINPISDVGSHDRAPTVLSSTPTIEASTGKTERELIMDALRKNRWNRTATAKQLGLSYRQLRYRIKTLEIDEQ